MEFHIKNKAADIYIVEETDPDEIVHRIVAKNDIGVMDWGDPGNMIFVLMGSANDPEVARRINRAKGRPENQVLAVSGYAGLVSRLSDLDRSPALVRACKNTGLMPEEIIEGLFKVPVGVVVPAKETVPSWISNNVDGFNTVMVAGQSHNPKMVYRDLYNQVVQKLGDEYDTPCAASSANRSNKDVFTVYQQEGAYAELRNDIDFFVMRADLHPGYRRKEMTSCTALAFEDDEITLLKRWGSKDFRRFKKFLREINVPDSVDILPGAEILWGTLFAKNLSLAMRLRLGHRLLRLPLIEEGFAPVLAPKIP